MDLKTIIQHYWPYWLLGLSMIIATLCSEHKDLMRFQKDSFFKFLRFMMIVTVIRIIIFHFDPPTMASAAPVLQIPLYLILMTWWEDPVHTLSLAVASRFLGESKPAKILTGVLTGMVAISFSLAHLYQGIVPALMISLYVPIVTKLGKKHGFSTIIFGHMLYDFVTLLTIRLFLGL